MLNTPVLFLIFNRPETTKQVFEAIRSVKPKQLFIAADGPRKDKIGEKERSKEAREIATTVDWDCDVKLLFRDENLGCGIGVSSAIDWFFDHVEAGIILEDDCLPDKSFFFFCEQMLDRYRLEHKVQIITGTNYLFGQGNSNSDYFFSNVIAIWGWATWKRTWESYSFNLKEYDKSLFYRLYSKDFANYLTSMLDAAVNNKIDTWDIQLSYAILNNKGLAVIPFNNLVKNIGYVGTHSIVKSRFQDMETKPFPGNDIKHPAIIVVNQQNDSLAIKNIISGEKLKISFFENIYIRLKNIYVKIINKTCSS